MLFEEAEFCPGFVDSTFDKLDTSLIETGHKTNGIWYSNKWDVLLYTLFMYTEFLTFSFSH